MKHLLIMTSLVLLLAGVTMAQQGSVKISDAVSGIQLLDQSQAGLSMKMDIGSVEFNSIGTKEGTFLLPTVSGFTRSQHDGEPNLPMITKLLSVPFGCELRVQVVNYKVEEIDLNSLLGTTELIVPVQPSLSKSDDPDAVPFVFNRTLYQQPGFYHQPLVSSKIKGVMRSLNIGQVIISPFEYDPVANLLRVYSDITLEITYDHPDWGLTQEMHEKYYSPFFESSYQQLINYEGSPALAGGKDDLVTEPVVYAIVADDMHEAMLQPFIEWKTKKGFNVITAYTGDIGTSNTVIKAYLQDLYNNPAPGNNPPSFVLLVGDDQEIQAFSGSTGSHITDKKFVEFTGNVFPEIYIGRFSAHSTDLLQPQIDKTLEYEMLTMPDPSYLGNVIMTAGVDAGHGLTHGNGQINYGTIHYFNAAHGINSHTYLYPDSDDPGAPAAIIGHVNDGIGFMNYTAHCGHSSQSDPSFTVTDIYGLTNIHKYGTGIGNCCLANTFGDDYSTPCFGEAWLQSENKGGIGYLASTNSTYWDEDYWWGIGNGPVIGAGPTYEQTGLGAYDGVFHDHGEPQSDWYVTNQAMVFAGNMAVSEAGSSKEAYYWECYHTMGDPSVSTYMGVPSVNPVSHSANILMTATEFQVDADPWSYIGISRGGVLHGAALVDGTGSVMVPIEAFGTPGDVDLVVTCQNREPYITTVLVIAPDGPYVVYDDHDINDASGNNDGLINCGETILMGLQLKNVGPDTAFNVEATLSTVDTFVTMLDDYENYGTVAGNDGLAYIADAFQFKVASTAPDDHRINFQIDVTGTDRDLWQGSFNVTVHSPNVGYVSVAINDVTGNGNGILDPGETADLVVTVENTGSASATAVTAILTEDDLYVSISDDYGDFGNLTASGGTGDNSLDVFTVSADGACPMGHGMTFTVELGSSSGYAALMTFDIIVGDREAIYFDDFSFDQGWTGMGGSAEWTIGPCVGGSGSDSYGGPDPSEDHSPGDDNYVLGNDLTSGSGGDYNSSISGTHWAYSPVIDCFDYTGVQLTFYRCLGIESVSYDHAYFEVYNGTAWVNLFENGATMDDGSWTEQFFDLSAYADDNDLFQIRFGLGGTDGSQQYCGWNIDDITLKGYNQGTGTPLLDLATPEVIDTLFEGDATLDSILIRNTGDGRLKIRFTSSDSWLSFYLGWNTILAYDSMFVEIAVSTAGLPCGDHTGALAFETNDLTNPTGSIPFYLNIPAPALAVDVVEIDDDLEGGEQDTIPMIISNNGSGQLNYTVACQMFNGKGTFTPEEPAVPAGHRMTDLEKEPYTEPFFSPIEKGAGGPDAFGYRWSDSDEPGGPVYNWIDISTVGTEITTLEDDNFTGPIPIGFVFPYYESAYNELYVGSNGIVTFGAGSSSRSNQVFPYTLTPNNLIAMWWDDLDVEESGNVYYYYDTAEGHFVLSFVAVPNYRSPDGTGSLTFQLVLTPDGKILMQYGTMDPGDDSQGLAGASIGIEDSVGSSGLLVTYNAPYMHDNMAILFYSWRWLSTVPVGGTVAPFSQDTVQVMLNANNLEDGDYTGQLNVNCNDPMNPTHVIPVTLTVGGPQYICGDVNGDSEGPNMADLTYLVAYLFASGPPPPVEDAANVNGTEGINVADLTYLVAYLFNNGPAPNCP